MSYQFNERIASNAPSTAKVALERGESQRTYPLTINTPSDIYTACKQILGYTNYAPSGSGGKMNRIPPLADPMFAMFFADSIPLIRGVGLPVQTSPNPQLEVPTVGDFAFYPQYDFVVNFSQRQYSVLTDNSITVSSGTWTKPDGTTTQSYQFPSEWQRYTDCFPVKPDGNYLTQQGSSQAGSMVFHGGDADGKSCAFLPFVRVPNFYVSLIWRQVPLRYITSKNSYIMNKGWQNTVNQTQMQLPWNGPGDSCQPGTLLYVDFSYQAYTPPTGLDWNTYSNGDMSQKLVDITLNFIWTTRMTSDATVTPSNPNYVVGGHNLLYWHGDLNPHYCTIEKTGSGYNGRPTYLSSPLQMLQADPDAPGAI